MILRQLSSFRRFIVLTQQKIYTRFSREITNIRTDSPPSREFHRLVFEFYLETRRRQRDETNATMAIR